MTAAPDSLIVTGIGGTPGQMDLCALEIRDSRIARVWNEHPEIPAGVRVLDLGGATILPGIEDSHLHAYEFGRSLTALNVAAAVCPDLVALQKAVAHATPESSGWIRGIGWDDTRLTGTGPAGMLCAGDIDGAQPDVPVLLTDVTGHQAVVNSAALRLAGITAQTPDPQGGVIVRDAKGMPTGLLREGAIGLVNAAMPRLAPADKRAAILAAQQHLLALGVTSVTEPGLGPGASTLMDGSGDLDVVQAYRDLADEGELHLRVEVMLLFGGLGGTRANDVAAGLDAWGVPSRMAPLGHLGVAQVKVFADGIPRSRTAWMIEPYDDCTHGHLTVAGDTDQERERELRAIILAASSRGWQVGVHTTGDRASQATVAAFVEQETDASSLRHYIIHGDFTPRQSLALMAQNGITLNANPGIRWMIGDGVAGIIGPRRTAERQPLRTAWELGVNVCSSSDAPVTPPDWRPILAAAVTRSVRTDPERTDGEGLTMDQAVASMTTNAAWQSHAEGWRGRVAEGMAADLVVLDGTLDPADPWALTDVPARATLVGGVVRHGSL